MTQDDELAALEQRAIDRADAQLQALNDRWDTILTDALAAAGAVAIVEILSDTEIDTALAAALTVARDLILAILTAAYAAGARVATTAADADLASADLTRDDVGDDPGHLAAITAAVVAAHQAARTDLARRLTADAVTVGVSTAVRRLRVSVRAAASVAVHLGYTDTQLALWKAAAAHNTHLRLVKRWTAETDCCPACDALNGIELPLDVDFDATATSDPSFTPPKPYLTMAGPPRHPNCRCRLVTTVADSSRALHRVLTRPAPAGYTYLTAADVRRMPNATYRGLRQLLLAAIAKIRKLAERIIRGG